MSHDRQEGRGAKTITTRHILLVDDEARLLETVARALHPEEFSTAIAGSAEEAFSLLQARPPDLIVLDIGLPQSSGLDLLARLRSAGVVTPVLLLTAQNEPEDRVRGLEAGADDYLGKPFSLPELIARVRALLRRAGGHAPPQTEMTVGDLRLDPVQHVATRGDIRLDLTSREFALLVYLAEQKGGVVSREMLAKNVWHETSRFTPLNNVIDVQIARLRQKLDEPFPTRLLHTVRGLGFRLKEQA
ncbi:response regulator transcription factor [Acidipila sp. EB88]|uniref:response regulator transcription factor n=1 Tax=Acidipila sp. EB88 TaxID=2305226 RepID=UPI000F5D718F|nr:response regulator transcription factor [Acidipila sp. EB88]RRA49156.1 DNA-binding response regulator [Acidipila sp. EB88]